MNKKITALLLATFGVVSAKVDIDILNSIKSRDITATFNKDSVISYNKIFTKFSNSLLYIESQDDKSLNIPAVIVSKDGYVVAYYSGKIPNKSFIAKDINSQKYELSLIDFDSSIALFKINNSKFEFTPISFANSDELKIGDIVFGVNISQSIKLKISKSFIYSIDKKILSSRVDEPFIFDSRGGLISINGYIPSNLLKSFIESFTDENMAKYGLDGAILIDLNNTLKESYKRDYGVLLKRVRSNSLSYRSGLRGGDLIISCGKEPIKDSKSLLEILSAQNRGKIDFEYIRDKEINSLTYSLDNSIKTSSIASRTSISTGDSNKNISGLTLTTISSEDRKKYSILPNIDGVLVSSVEPNSYAKELDLRVGDVIIEIEGKEIHSIEDFNKRMQRLSGIKKRVFIVRDSWTMIVVVK